MSEKMSDLVKQVMMVYDQNKNGLIELKEAQNLIGDILKSSGLKADNDSILKIFNTYDKDKNNILDSSEIKALLEMISKRLE